MAARFGPAFVATSTNLHAFLDPLKAGVQEIPGTRKTCAQTSHKHQQSTEKREERAHNAPAKWKAQAAHSQFGN
eukprot:1650336-Prymnesium_polylepis.1